MNARLLVLVAGLGSAGLLVAAIGFQHFADLAPCKLCYWQRYPHVAAVVVAAVVLITGWTLLAWLGAMATATTSSIGIYHVGVEQGWWEGPTTCTSGPIGGLSTEQLLDQIMTAPLVRCDEIQWELFGITMAGYNALIAAGLTVIWIAAARAQR